MLKVNQNIPSFSLISDQKEIINQDSLKGKITVLYFYPKDNTPGCTNEAIDFSNLINEFDAYNVNVFGISKDNIESHKAFKEKYDLEFSLLSDPELTVHKLFGAYGTKTSFGKTTEGVIRSTFIISEDLKVLYTNYKVSVKGHAEAIFSKIKDLLVKQSI